MYIRQVYYELNMFVIQKIFELLLNAVYIANIGRVLKMADYFMSFYLFVFLILVYCSCDVQLTLIYEVFFNFQK